MERYPGNSYNYKKCSGPLQSRQIWYAITLIDITTPNRPKTPQKIWKMWHDKSQTLENKNFILSDSSLIHWKLTQLFFIVLNSVLYAKVLTNVMSYDWPMLLCIQVCSSICEPIPIRYTQSSLRQYGKKAHLDKPVQNLKDLSKNSAKNQISYGRCIKVLIRI